jgi:hypothetical protein
VRCAECDVHLPESEAITDDGRHFCGREHLEAFNDRAAGSR